MNKELQIKKQVIAKLRGDYEPIILQDKLKNQTDSFFYEGDIARIVKPNGTILTLIATGDIRVNIKDKQYRNNQINDAISDWDLTDGKLRELEESGELEWCENNWFEVVWQKKGEDYIDSDMGVVVGLYDEGIELLKSYWEDDTY